MEESKTQTNQQSCQKHIYLLTEAESTLYMHTYFMRYGRNAAYIIWFFMFNISVIFKIKTMSYTYFSPYVHSYFPVTNISLVIPERLPPILVLPHTPLRPLQRNLLKVSGFSNKYVTTLIQLRFLWKNPFTLINTNLKVQLYRYKYVGVFSYWNNSANVSSFGIHQWNF